MAGPPEALRAEPGGLMDLRVCQLIRLWPLCSSLSNFLFPNHFW